MRMSSSIVHAFGTPPSMTKASTSYSESSVYEFGRHEQIKNIPTQNFSYLIKYRSIKPNESMKIGKAGEKSYIPDVICDIFNLGDRNSQSENIKKKYQVQCSCGKTEDGLCELIMGWIEDEYYWKTDKQFHKIYDYYQNKKLDQGQQLDLKIKMSRIQQVLGIEIGNEQRLTVLQILANYKKHAQYYNKHRHLLKASDIFIWICIGICYHTKLSDSSNKLNKIVSFWALDIAMDRLSPNSDKREQNFFIEIKQQALRNFQYYFQKWLELLRMKGVKLEEILAEWISQFMFGYMGIQAIAFFMDCFWKSGSNYLIKVMLSYFQFRTKQICKQKTFLQGTISPSEFIKLIVNGKEEWPMIFCSASSFYVKN